VNIFYPSLAVASVRTPNQPLKISGIHGRLSRTSGSDVPQAQEAKNDLFVSLGD